MLIVVQNQPFSIIISTKLTTKRVLFWEWCDRLRTSFISVGFRCRKARTNSSRSLPSPAICCEARSHHARLTHSATNTSVAPPESLASLFTFNSNISVSCRQTVALTNGCIRNNLVRIRFADRVVRSYGRQRSTREHLFARSTATAVLLSLHD